MLVYKVKLSKIDSNHTRLRTDTIEGFTVLLPQVGKKFSLIGEALDPAMTGRSVTTSEVAKVIKEENKIIFETQNSVYKVEVLGTEEIE